MPSCAVIVCKNRSDHKRKGVTYHRFPNDINFKEKWINSTGRGPDWRPTKQSTICSVHFLEEHYKPHTKIRKLFEWAVPSLKLRLVFAPANSNISRNLQCSPDRISIDSEPQIKIENETDEQITIEPGIGEQIKTEPGIHEQIEIESESNKQIKIEPGINEQIKIVPEIDDQITIGPDFGQKIKMEPGIHEKIEIEPDIDEQVIIEPETNEQITIEPGIEETPKEKILRIEVEKYKKLVEGQQNTINRLYVRASRYKKRAIQLTRLLKELQQKNSANSDQA